MKEFVSYTMVAMETVKSHIFSRSLNNVNFEKKS